MLLLDTINRYIIPDYNIYLRTLQADCQLLPYMLVMTIEGTQITKSDI